MKNKIIKIGAVCILTMSLGCTQMLNVKAEHVHNSYPRFSRIARTITTPHQYATAVNHDKNGNVVGFQYGTCYVSQQFHEYEYVCIDCGMVTGQAPTRTVTVHSVNH